MASASVVKSPRNVQSAIPWYRALRDSLPFLSVSNDGNNSSPSVAPAEIEKVEEEEKSAEDVIDTKEQVLKKPRNKFGKKKEIVSSSTVVPRLEVCTGKKCKAKGSNDLLTAFQTASDGRVEIAYTKCMHECKQGMNTRATTDGTTFAWNHEVSVTDVEPILCKHFDW